MKKLINKLLATGPYPFPLDEIEDYTRSFKKKVGISPSMFRKVNSLG